jgi:phenylpropionate dioxygenase-like ring-hydroxylating dioxygenase large terminal subunit
MHRQQQIALAERLIGHVDTKTTAQTDRVRGVEISAYFEPDLLRREKETLFRQWPLVAGLSADIPNVGDFRTLEMLETPVLLVRGRDAKARAFVNVCRHRGAMVEGQACGNRKLFSCPFHAWGYNTEGELAAIPHAESFGAVDKRTLALTPLPLAEKYGLVWVLLQPNGAPFEIDDYLGGLQHELAGWDLGRSVVAGRDRLHNRMNWKFAIDTFGETYHFESLHKATVNMVFHSNTQLYDIFGRNHRMVFAGREIESLKHVPKEQWDIRLHSLLAYYLFPNTQLLVQRGGISLFRIFPAGDDPQSCITDLTFYGTPNAAGEVDEMQAKMGFMLTRDVIRDEDYAMAEMAQKSLKSGAHTYAVFGRNEPALHHYHETYRGALGMGPLVTL